MTVVIAVCNRYPAFGLTAVTNEAVGPDMQILVYTELIDTNIRYISMAKVQVLRMRLPNVTSIIILKYIRAI